MTGSFQNAGSFSGSSFTYYDIHFLAASGTATINGPSTFHDMTFTCGGFIQNAVTIHNILMSSGGTITGNTTINDVTAVGAATITGNNNIHDVTTTDACSISGHNVFHNVSIGGDGDIAVTNTFNDLTFSAGHKYELFPSSNTTVNGNWSLNGTCNGYIDIHCKTAGFFATVTHPTGAVTGTYLLLKDITATGGSGFTANSSIDLGNNTGWTINSSTARNLYWVNNSGDWSDGNHWALTSGGAPTSCPPPTPVDNVFFDANSFSSGNQTVNVTAQVIFCKNMTWTGVTNTPKFLTSDTAILLKIYGSLTFVSGMTVSFGGSFDFEAKTPGQTVTMAGKNIGNRVRFNGIGGGWTFQDAFSCTSRWELNAGTLNTNNQTVNSG
ncbi:MAG TPA: hypothetical protein VKH37_12485, partial [Ferruginibacter sp.]|nr:hypothetical protein [Ferruginibacter sp.]